jgi:uncharacterized membrane protein
MLARNEEYFRQHEEAPDKIPWRKIVMICIQAALVLGMVFLVPPLSAQGNVEILLRLSGALLIIVLLCTMICDFSVLFGPFLRERHYLVFLAVSVAILLVMIYRL